MSTATLIDNATTVANMYEAFGRGDITFILSNLADDCKWIGAGEGSLPQGGTYVGKDASTFFKRLLENEEFNSFNPISIHNINDDEVAAFGDMIATSKATGIKVSCDWVMHWKFNDEGKVVYFHDFFDTAAAYRANQKPKNSDAIKDEKIAIVQDAFDNFQKGNIQPIIDKCADDVEWSSHENPAVPYGKTYHGKKGVAEFFSTLAGNINYSEFKPKEYYTDGEKVFVKGSHKATVKSTGKIFSHDLLMEFSVRDGKVNSFFAYVDTRDQAKAFESN